MKKQIKIHFDHEITSAKKLIQQRDYSNAFKHLERAHVLGQSYVIMHTISHYYMLLIGFKTFNIKEIIGQIVRLPLGVIGSAFNIIPVGNTGGSNVNPFKAMVVSQDLKKLMIDSNSSDFLS